MKEKLIQAGVISNEDKSWLQDAAVEAIEVLVLKGLTEWEATDLVSTIISATRDSYGD